MWTTNLWSSLKLFAINVQFKVEVLLYGKLVETVDIKLLLVESKRSKS